MWRAFFCAIGFSALILGGEFLLITRATLTLPADSSTQQNAFISSVRDTIHTREFVPPEWAPWTLLSFGAVVVLYSGSVAKD